MTGLINIDKVQIGEDFVFNEALGPWEYTCKVCDSGVGDETGGDNSFTTTGDRS